MLNFFEPAAILVVQALAGQPAQIARRDMNPRELWGPCSPSFTLNCVPSKHRQSKDTSPFLWNRWIQAKVRPNSLEHLVFSFPKVINVAGARDSELFRDLSRCRPSRHAVVTVVERRYQRSSLFTSQIAEQCSSRDKESIANRLVRNGSPRCHLNFAILIQIFEEMLEISLGESYHAIPLPSARIDRWLQLETVTTFYYWKGGWWYLIACAMLQYNL